MFIIPVMLAVVIFLIVTLPYLGIESLLRKKDPHGSDVRELRLIQWLFRLVLKMSFIKIEIHGEENVPKEEALLYVANHRGIFDVVATYSRCPQPTGFVSKISLSKIPLLRLHMTRLNCLFIDRDDIKQSLKTILAAIDKVKNGISIFIFPEGTRNRDYDHPEQMLPFKEGSFKVATKTGCKIIPIAIIGTDQILEKQFPWIHPHKITLVYGKPVDPKALSKEELKHIGAYVQGIVQNMLNEQLGIVPEQSEEAAASAEETAANVQ